MAHASARIFAVLALALVASVSAVPANRPPPKHASVAELVAKTKTLSTLLSLVTQANLTEALGADFNGTVYAPANRAFTALPAATLDKVKANSTLLTKVLTYHVSEDPAKFTRRGKAVTTLAGEKVRLTQRFETIGKVLFVKGAANAEPSKILRKVRAGKAIVYIISDVLLPEAL